MASLFDYLQDIFFALFSRNPQEAEKRRQLRTLHERLRQVSPPYYRRAAGQLSPSFAYILLQLAYLLQPLSDLFAKTIYNEESRLAERYRDYLAVARLPEPEQQRLSEFSHAAMRARVLGAASPLKELEKIREEHAQLASCFSSSEFYSFDLDFTATDRLASLCRHDLSKLFGLFDPRFDPKQKSPKANFQPVSAQKALKELEDLYFILAGTELSAGVERNLFALLDRLERDRSSPSKEKVSTILTRLAKLIAQELAPSLLLALIRVIRGDPKYAPKTVGEEIPHLHAARARLEACFQKDLEKVLLEINESAIGGDLKVLFGGAELLEVEAYEDRIAKLLADREYESFTRIKPLRILKSYTLAHFEKTLRDPVKRLMIEASFANRIFQNMVNNTFHGCEAILSRLRQFEEGIKSGPASTEKIEKYLALHDQGKPVQPMIAKTVDTIEQEARKLIDEGSAYFYNLSVILSEVLTDAKQKAPALISNIKAVAGRSNKEFLAVLASGLNNLNLFLKVMRNFTEIRQDPAASGSRT